MSGLLAAANVLALAGAYVVWDLASWWRERYQAGQFRSVAGMVGVHAGLVVVYIAIMYGALSLPPD